MQNQKETAPGRASILDKASFDLDKVLKSLPPKEKLSLLDRLAAPLRPAPEAAPGKVSAAKAPQRKPGWSDRVFVDAAEVLKGLPPQEKLSLLDRLIDPLRHLDG